MGLFDNIKVLTDNVSKNVSTIANTIATQTRENENKKSLEKEINVINSEIDAAYKEIGSRFVEYILETKQMPGIDVTDVLNILEGKMSRKEELKNEIIEIEKRLNDQLLLQEKARVQEAFKMEKEKLDKALCMNVINEQEYNEKIRVHKNRIEYFEEIKNVETQLQMGIISFDEKEYKIKEILSRDIY